MTRKNGTGKYSIDEVLRILKKNPLIQVKDNIITCSPSSNPEDKFRIGNSTRGKLDFLSKWGYTIIWSTDDETVKDEALHGKTKVKAKFHVVKSISMLESKDESN